MEFALAEAAEAEALFDFATGVPAATASELGLVAGRRAGGVVLSMSARPNQFWNRAVGFGPDARVTGEVVSELIDYYRTRGSASGVLQVASSALPEDWDDIRARAALQAGSSWVLLVRDVDLPVPQGTLSGELRIATPDSSHARPFAEVMMDGLSDVPFLEMMGSAVGRAGWHSYAVWHGDEIVATASMRVSGDMAYLFGASTLPEWRRRGAQSALLAARIRDARAAGCRRLVTETIGEADGEHNTSLHNMLRLGFTVAYERQRWIFHP